MGDDLWMQRRTGTAAIVASGLAAATTANAWRPTRSGPGSLPSFASGLVTSELPLASIGAQAAVFAGLAARGHVHGRSGRIALAASVASAGGLLALHRVALRSGDVLEDALVEGLGTEYRNHLGGYKATPGAARLTRAEVRVRLRSDRRRFVTGPVLAYGDAGRRNQLDVWRRPDLPTDGKAPVLVQVHGGAWVTGTKETQGVPLMKHLAESGWVCVAINYRLSPRATWPDHIVDVKRAIAWVREHIAGYGGDPDFVAITGGSAGGHLASLAALTPNLAAFQPGFEGADTTVQAAVPFYGIYDFANRDGTGRVDMRRLMEDRVFKTRFDADGAAWDLASPMSHVGPDVPPIFFLHGANDSLVPVEQARAMVRMQRAVATNPVVYAELPKAQHAFDVLGSVRAAHTVRAVARFLSYVRTTGASATERAPTDRMTVAGG